MNKVCGQVYLYIHKHTNICIHIFEINRFRNSHPGVFLKVGAPKMYTKACKDTCGKLHFLQRCGLWACNFVKMDLFHRYFSMTVLTILCYLFYIFKLRSSSVAASVDYRIYHQFYFIYRANIDRFVQSVRKSLVVRNRIIQKPGN